MSENNDSTKNPFVHGLNCRKCGNSTFHAINDGGCVLVLSCTKCKTQKDFLIATEDD